MPDNSRIDELVSTLEYHSDRHYQGSWFGDVIDSRAEFLSEECRTTACAAGWTIALYGTEEELLASGVRLGSIIPLVTRLLRLSFPQADWIFLDTAAFGAKSREAAIFGLKHVKDHPDATRHELIRAWHDTRD